MPANKKTILYLLFTMIFALSTSLSAFATDSDKKQNDETAISSSQEEFPSDNEETEDTTASSDGNEETTDKDNTEEADENDEEDLSVASDAASDDDQGEAEDEKADEKDEEKSDKASSDTYTVTFGDGGKVLDKCEVKDGEYPESIPQKDSDGDDIIAWVSDNTIVYNPADIAIEADTEYRVWKAPSLNDSHLPYMSGSDAAFRPEDCLTRGEFCSIVTSVFNITDNGITCDFSDITGEEWYADTVSALVKSGMMSGYPDNTFRAYNAMTRAEFVAVICKPFKITDAGVVFEDTKDHWAKNQLAYANSMNWVGGYDDNKINPDAPITRAEAVAVFNRLLKRSGANSMDMILSNNIRPFYDVLPSAWYYADVMEAAVSHIPEGEGNQEVWQSFEHKTHGFGNGVVTLNNIGYYIDANGQFCSFTPWSFVTVDGKTYYTTDLGNIDITLSGLVNLGGSMYYFQPDFSILQNGNYNQLYFDGTGKYTCGNAELDALVDNALAACTNDSMTFSEKLRAAYLYLRDNCRYLSRAHHPRGTTAFVEESATFMFKNMRGNCYCFASCFLLMARRLGCEDAYVVSGGVGTNNSDHAWVMINSRIYDPELEYAYRYRYAVKKYYNLYNMQRYATPFVYHFPY